MDPSTQHDPFGGFVRGDLKTKHEEAFRLKHHSMTVGFVTKQSRHLLMHLAKSTIAVSHGARMMYALNTKPDLASQ